MNGMGIGAFVDGMMHGYGIRQQQQAREEDRLDRESDRAWRDQQRNWMEEDRAYQQGERARAESDRKEIEQIHSDSRSRYDAEKAAGKFSEDFETWFRQDTLPRLQDELLSRGDVDGATKLLEWSESADAKKGSKLFAEAMFLANTGQHEQALDKVIDAGKVRGYISGDFDIDEKEPIQDEAGNTIGYRVILRDNDGNETVQDIALDDIPSVIATFANPVAAWESQVAARAANSKRETDMEDYRRKKEIDASFSPDKGRESAIKSLRDRIKADPLTDGSVNFDDLPREERERMISDEISFMNGVGAQPSPPARRVIMDNSNGQPAPAQIDGQALQQAPGIGAVPGQPVQRPGTAAPLAAPARGNAVINGKVDPGLPAPPSPSELVDQAVQQLVEGKNPQEVARTLRAVGVDENNWPPELKRLTAAAAPTGR